MEFVGAALGDEVDGGTGGLAESRVVDVGLDFELLHRVRRRRNREAAEGHVARVHAVDDRVIARGPRTVGGVRSFAEGRAELVVGEPAVIRGGARNQ